MSDSFGAIRMAMGIITCYIGAAFIIVGSCIMKGDDDLVRTGHAPEHDSFVTSFVIGAGVLILLCGVFLLGKELSI